VSTLDPLVAQLERTARRLREGSSGPEEAAELVERCAALAAELGAALEREERAARVDPPAGQESLLA